jgi:hypothetical protein
MQRIRRVECESDYSYSGRTSPIGRGRLDAFSILTGSTIDDTTINWRYSRGRSKICIKNEAAEPVIEGNTAHRDAAGWESARISIQAPIFAIDSLLISYA